MLFNSFIFLIFLILVIVIYYIIPDSNFRIFFLILSSICFLLHSNFVSLFVIIIISLFNYFIGIIIEMKRDFKIGGIIFILAIIINVSNLFFFKYYNFFNENLRILMNIIGLKDSLPYMNIILPLGISFYTFSVLGYLIEIKLGRNNSEKNFIFFINYMFFFPKLLAGPIERAHFFLPQSNMPKKMLWENISLGVKLIIWGFFLKLVIADRISIFIDSIYGSIEIQSGKTIIIYHILYTIQIYADFAGYTDIARGISKIFGYDLLENFNRPLLSYSLTDFWRRWHISLSSWINDYVYTPLTLKFRNWGLFGIIISLFISFIIVGIWHGALWTFVIFGILQGLFLTIELLTLKKRKFYFSKSPQLIIKLLGIIYTFSFVTLTLILFRAPTLKTAGLVYNKIFTKGNFQIIGNVSMFIYPLIGIVILFLRDFVIEYFNKDILNINSKFYLIRCIPYIIIIQIIMLFGVFDGGQFIYFKF